MKKTVFLASALVLFACACKHKNKEATKEVDSGKLQNVKQQAAQAKAAQPVMHFDKTDYDFGTIKEGDKVTTLFRFTNTGKSPLVIRNAYGSCGCTVPEYPKNPIAAGERGSIRVTFDSSGKHGKQHKDVTLVTNTAKEKEHLHIMAEVSPEKP